MIFTAFLCVFTAFQCLNQCAVLNRSVALSDTTAVALNAVLTELMVDKRADAATYSFEARPAEPTGKALSFHCPFTVFSRSFTVLLLCFYRRGVLRGRAAGRLGWAAEGRLGQRTFLVNLSLPVPCVCVHRLVSALTPERRSQQAAIGLWCARYGWLNRPTGDPEAVHAPPKLAGPLAARLVTPQA